MLLSAYSDRFDFLSTGADFFEAFPHRNFRRIDPSRRILFDVAGWQSFNCAVGGVCKCENFVFFNIEDKGQLVRIDAVAMKVLDTWELPGCEEPTGLALDSEHARLFSACHNGTMAVTDATLSEVAKLAQVRLYYSSNSPAYVRSHTALLSTIQALAYGVYSRNEDQYADRIKAFKLK